MARRGPYRSHGGRRQPASRPRPRSPAGPRGRTQAPRTRRASQADQPVDGPPLHGGRRVRRAEPGRDEQGDGERGQQQGGAEAVGEVPDDRAAGGQRVPRSPWSRPAAQYRPAARGRAGPGASPPGSPRRGPGRAGPGEGDGGVARQRLGEREASSTTAAVCTAPRISRRATTKGAVRSPEPHLVETGPVERVGRGLGLDALDGAGGSDDPVGEPQTRKPPSLCRRRCMRA